LKILKFKPEICVDLSNSIKINKCESWFDASEIGKVLFLLNLIKFIFHLYTTQFNSVSYSLGWYLLSNYDKGDIKSNYLEEVYILHICTVKSRYEKSDIIAKKLNLPVGDNSFCE